MRPAVALGEREGKKSKRGVSGTPSGRNTRVYYIFCKIVGSRGESFNRAVFNNKRHNMLLRDPLLVLKWNRANYTDIWATCWMGKC